ncbi:MAG: malate synthase A, partial [Bdellovibrionota bacterium]
MLHIHGRNIDGLSELLVPEARDFLTDLHREFNPVREKLLRYRAKRQTWLDAGNKLGFLDETRTVRESSW